MLGAVLKIMTTINNDKVKQLMKKLITHSQSSNALNERITNLIIEDIITLYKQHCEAHGAGVLVFCPSNPSRSNFTTARDLLNDRAVAEENCEDDLALFLSKAAEIAQKIKGSEKAAILMTGGDDLKLFVLDLEQAVDNIKNLFQRAIFEF
jgi:hypothetical protein